jgi:hypothetical protein
VLGEPSLHLLGLVGLVVVADRVHVEVLFYRPIDLLQETDELLGAVTRQALADDRKRREASTVIVLADSSEWGG